MSKELDALLKQTEALRVALDSGIVVLTGIQKEIRRLQRGDPKVGKPKAMKAGDSKAPKSAGKVKTSEALEDLELRASLKKEFAASNPRQDQCPPDSFLSNVACPICKAGPMVWRFNRMDRRYFAGCPAFQGRNTNSCRGTRTREDALALQEQRLNASPDAAPDCTCTVRRRDPHCPVGEEFGNHPIGATMEEARKNAEPPVIEVEHDVPNKTHADEPFDDNIPF